MNACVATTSNQNVHAGCEVDVGHRFPKDGMGMSSSRGRRHAWVLSGVVEKPTPERVRNGSEERGNNAEEGQDEPEHWHLSPHDKNEE
jgi:hypothetical protein